LPSERWLLPEDQRLTAEYKSQLGDAVNRRFNVVLDTAPLSDTGKSLREARKARLKRNQEIFYRCYRSVEKVSDLPQTFNAQYGLFRGLLTTFVVLAIISLSFVVWQRWFVFHRFVFSPHLSFASAAVLGSLISYQRTRKRGEDFAKAVLDVFLINNPKPAA
jgi:hypothetical protein